MSSNSKFCIGLLLCFIGAVLGLYVGIWVCFVGGIVDLINQIKAPELSALTVAIGLAKVFFAGVAGWLSAFFFIVPGAAFIQDA